VTGEKRRGQASPPGPEVVTVLTDSTAAIVPPQGDDGRVVDLEVERARRRGGWWPPGCPPWTWLEAEASISGGESA
jgi:hypothetical protein